MVKEKILDTAPIYRSYFPHFMPFMSYILCFTDKRLICYFCDYYASRRYGPSSKFEKKLIKQEKELKSYNGDIEGLIAYHENNFDLLYEDVVKVRFWSIFFIKVKMNEKHNHQVITFDFIVNNRKYVKSLFRRYLPSITLS